MLLRKASLHQSIHHISEKENVLKERGFIEQLTHEEEIKALFEKGGVTFYIGIDPTADSLHVGHFLTVMAMAHMQRCGNRPICLMGGGRSEERRVGKEC